MGDSMRGANPSTRRRGTAIVYFLVLLSVLTTGLIASMALAGGTQTQIAGLTLKRDQAFYAAEAGVQHAFWRLQQNNNYRADAAAPLTGTFTNGSAYSVTVVGDWNSPLLITSVGTAGGAASVTVTASCSPLSIVPAITLGNNFDNNGNVIINGDVQAKGNVTTSGRFRMAGSIIAGGSINTNGSVDISGSSLPNQDPSKITLPVIDVQALRNQAVAQGRAYNVPNGGKKAQEVTTLNFGNGGVIWFDGPISLKGNVNVIGTGTLVVDGDLIVQSAASLGSSNAPALVNIVTTSNASRGSPGDLDIGGYLGLIGSIYTQGKISKNGGFDVTGVIVGYTDLNTSGGMNITRAQPPAFDPRSNTSGAGTMVLSRITGPIF